MCRKASLVLEERLLKFDLDREHRLALLQSFAGLPQPESHDSETFIRRAFRSLVQTLPDQLLDILSSVKDSPQPPGAVIIRGGPVGELPTTPPDGRCRSPQEVQVAKAYLLAIARLCGTPYSYQVEKGGDLVHYVVPVKGKESSLTNMGSIDELGFHTELAYFPHQPRRLILYCLRPDHERKARTPVADIRDALQILPAATVAELRTPQFRVRCPFIFDPMLEPDRRYSEARPVVSGPAASPEVRVALYGNLTQADTPAGTRALAALDSAIQAVARQIKLDAGDLMILDNFTVLHARTSFTPRFDGSDRWLLRCHVTDSLWPHRHIQVDSLRVLASPVHA
jgi:L-asparagine oxygenase